MRKKVDEKKKEEGEEEIASEKGAELVGAAVERDMDSLERRGGEVGEQKVEGEGLGGG